MLGRRLGVWEFPQWLGRIPPFFPQDDPTIKLGETGDFLTGWLQPLALSWFVIAVLLQFRELRLQRKEFSKLKDEYRGNKEATELQAKHLALANTLANRELVRSIIQDSKNLVQVNAIRSEHALEEMIHRLHPSADETAVKQGKSVEAWVIKLRTIVKDGGYQHLSIKRIYEDEWSPQKTENRLWDLIERMADQYLNLKKEAEGADMDEYYDAFCADTIEGEVTKLSRNLVEQMRDRSV